MPPETLGSKALLSVIHNYPLLQKLIETPVNDIEDSCIIRVKGHAFVGHKRPPNVQRKDYEKQL